MNQSSNSKSPSPRPKTSKGRFGEFVEKLKKGKLGDDRRDKSDRSKSGRDNKKKLSPEDKLKRCGYLRLYIQQLWPHWKMVALLGFLAVSISVLEAPEIRSIRVTS